MSSSRATLALQVPGTIDAIHPATVRAEAWLVEQQVSFEAMYLVSLAIEELVTNCIKYGYQDSNDHTIDFLLSVSEGTLRLDVIDDGSPFNPLEATRPDLSLPPEKRPIGGLGLHLLRELADEMNYERKDGTNRLRLTKRMS